MKLMCAQPIRLRADLTLAPGDEFETDQHALSERHVAELLAIGAATVVLMTEPVEPADPADPVDPAEPAAPAKPAKPAKAAAATKAAR